MARQALRRAPPFRTEIGPAHVSVAAGPERGGRAGGARAAAAGWAARAAGYGRAPCITCRCRRPNTMGRGDRSDRGLPCAWRRSHGGDRTSCSAPMTGCGNPAIPWEAAIRRSHGLPRCHRRSHGMWRHGLRRGDDRTGANRQVAPMHMGSGDLAMWALTRAPSPRQDPATQESPAVSGRQMRGSSAQPTQCTAMPPNLRSIAPGGGKRVWFDGGRSGRQIQRPSVQPTERAAMPPNLPSMARGGGKGGWRVSKLRIR